MHSLHSAASYLYTNYENVMSQPGKGFLVWLAGLSVLGFLATDMYLPAFARHAAGSQHLRRLH